MEYYWIIGVFVIILLIIFLIWFNKRKQSKKINDVLKLLTSINKEQGITNYTLEYEKKDTHDIYYENDHNIYYIKIINNPNNQEICVNNAIKWQLRKFRDNNNSMEFVSGIEALMRMDLKNQTKKEHKLYIVYPNSRALLKVINECEMVFIYPDTDVYGANILTYKKIEENPNLLKL